MDKIIPELEIAQIKTTLDRILVHHDDFKKMFEKMDGKLDDVSKQVHGEETARMKSVETIKDELHGRINQILFSILGGAALFVGGIIMWIIETKR